MLVEVMVGAVVLAIAATAILGGIDGAQNVGAKNKAKSIQASLAQQDIERMRSLPLSRLEGLSETNTINVAGVDYTVVSSTAWISDQAGAVNCSSTAAKADYLKLTSTVSSPATGTKTVTETGLLTPPATAVAAATGTATVQLQKRDGTPLSSVTVNLSGASSQSATTNSLGCAVFGSIPVGTYTITVNNYVEMESSLPATGSMQVYPGRGTFAPMQVDRPATVDVTFVPPLGVQTWTTSMVWDSITAKNAGLTGAEKTFTNGSRVNSFDATNLYPFLNGVGVYAGSCDANDPSAYSSSYFNATPPARGVGSPLTPASTTNVNVEMPTLHVTVTRQAVGSPATVPSWTRTQLLVTQNDGTTCDDVIHQLAPTRTASTATVTFDIAQPFGHYTLCVSTRGQTSSTNSTVVDRKITANVDMTNVPGTLNRQQAFTTTATTSGVCF
jgi:type II secretory pathway pseudopilin PulG